MYCFHSFLQSPNSSNFQQFFFFLGDVSQIDFRHKPAGNVIDEGCSGNSHFAPSQNGPFCGHRQSPSEPYLESHKCRLIAKILLKDNSANFTTLWNCWFYFFLQYAYHGPVHNNLADGNNDISSFSVWTAVNLLSKQSAVYGSGSGERADVELSPFTARAAPQMEQRTPPRQWQRVNTVHGGGRL